MNSGKVAAGRWIFQRSGVAAPSRPRRSLADRRWPDRAVAWAEWRLSEGRRLTTAIVLIGPVAIVSETALKTSGFDAESQVLEAKG